MILITIGRHKWPDSRAGGRRVSAGGAVQLVTDDGPVGGGALAGLEG